MTLPVCRLRIVPTCFEPWRAFAAICVPRWLRRISGFVGRSNEFSGETHRLPVSSSKSEKKKHHEESTCHCEVRPLFCPVLFSEPLFRPCWWEFWAVVAVEDLGDDLIGPRR